MTVTTSMGGSRTFVSAGMPLKILQSGTWHVREVKVNSLFFFLFLSCAWTRFSVILLVFYFLFYFDFSWDHHVGKTENEETLILVHSLPRWRLMVLFMRILVDHKPYASVSTIWFFSLHGEKFKIFLVRHHFCFAQRLSFISSDFKFHFFVSLIWL